MKKVKYIFSLFLISLVLCGCQVKQEYGMVINKNKSVNISYIQIMDLDAINIFSSMGQTDGSQEVLTEEQIWASMDSMKDEEFEKNGFKVERYDKDGFKGYSYTKTISSIDLITGDSSNIELNNLKDIDKSVVFTKNNDKYSFKTSAKVDNGYNIDTTSTEGYEFIFTVTLPNKPISHNATKVSEDGKTLTWNLLSNDLETIEFEFSFENNLSNYIMYGAIAGGVILLIIIISIIISSIKKKGNKEDRKEKQLKKKKNKNLETIDSIPQPQLSFDEEDSSSSLPQIQLQTSDKKQKTEPIKEEFVPPVIEPLNDTSFNQTETQSVPDIAFMQNEVEEPKVDNSKIQLVNQEVQQSVWSDTLVQQPKENVSTVQQSSITVEQKNIPQEVAQAPTSDIQPEKPVFDIPPTMEHPSEPMIMQQEEKEKPKQEVNNMPSVADILGIAEQNYNQSQ